MVTDYQKLPGFKTDIQVKNTVNEAVNKLDVTWEYNSNIFNRSVLSSLCIPCVFENKYLLHNEIIDNLNLNPERPDVIFSAIDNFYISDIEDPLTLKEVVTLCKEGKHPKVESIEVFVEESSTKETGKTIISPQDYLIMADNYLLSHIKGFPIYETGLAFDKLAGDLIDFVRDFDYYEYTDSMTEPPEDAIDIISNDLKTGNNNGYINFLNEIILEEDYPAETFYRAKELIARLSKIEPTHEYTKSIDDNTLTNNKMQEQRAKGNIEEKHIR